MLAAGLIKTSRGELGGHITTQEQAMAKDDIWTFSRQILKLVYDYNKRDEANGALFTLKDILHAELKGDTLAKFKNDRDATFTRQNKPLEEDEVLKPLLLRQLRRSGQLKEELTHYERAEPGSEPKTYAFLYNCLTWRIELNRQNNNRSALVASRGNDNPTKPSAPGPKAKPEGRVKSRGMSKGRDGVGGDAILQPFPTYASHFGKLAHALEGNIVHSSTKGARQPRGRQRRKAKAKPDREDSPGPGEPPVPKESFAHFRKGCLQVRRPMSVDPLEGWRSRTSGEKAIEIQETGRRTRTPRRPTTQRVLLPHHTGPPRPQGNQGNAKDITAKRSKYANSTPHSDDTSGQKGGSPIPDAEMTLSDTLT